MDHLEIPVPLQCPHGADLRMKFQALPFRKRVDAHPVEC